jgi:hypothetical protein
MVLFLNVSSQVILSSGYYRSTEEHGEHDKAASDVNIDAPACYLERI